MSSSPHQDFKTSAMEELDDAELQQALAAAAEVTQEFGFINVVVVVVVLIVRCRT